VRPLAAVEPLTAAGPHLTGFERDQKRGEGEGGRYMEGKEKKKGDFMA
jgi:hypothetical protein